jgi:hypothetical protein
MDACYDKLRGARCSPRPPAVTNGTIDVEAIVAHSNRLLGPQNLHLEYSDSLLHWMLKRADAKRVYGDLQRVGVYGDEGTLIGWYLYYENVRGEGRVLQICADEGQEGRVLDALFFHAWRRGTAALSGRLEPHLVDAFIGRPEVRCHIVEFRMMVHTRNPELMSLIHRGRFVLSEFEGERIVGCQGE